MKSILNIIYYLTLVVFFIWLVRPFLFWLIGLEFKDFEIEFEYAYCWRFILPVAIMLTLSKDFIDNKKPENLLRVILERVGVACFTIVLVYLSLFTKMCGWSESEVYFVSNDGTSKIVLMEYGCGAYDSDINSKQDIKRIKQAGKYFNWVHSCDTTEVDRKEWLEVQ